MTLTKTIFRQKCLQKIKNTSKHNCLYRNFILNKRLFRELKEVKNARILFYYPLPMEANILKVLTKMRQKNEIYIPFMQGESFKMVPFRLPLKQNKFGIFEAGNTHTKYK